MAINNKKIIIATHVLATGPGQDLKEYLLNKDLSKLLFVGHPLFFDCKLNDSGFELYQHSKKCKEHFAPLRKKRFELIKYSRELFLDAYWSIKHDPKWDVYVGVDNLNALAGILLKRLGFVKRTVYYVIDYNPARFDNKIVNWLYHKIDQFCVRCCDETWNLSVKMAESRKKYFNFSGGYQKEVPIGIWYDRFPRLEYPKIEPHTLIYMGGVIKKQGIQYVVAAMPEIIKKIPDFKFKVVGGGDYVGTLIAEAKRKKVVQAISFTGFVKEHKDIEDMIVHGALAVALYEKYDDAGHLTYTNFTDPGKVKSYLASGLPVLISNVPPVARKIVAEKCGRIIDYDKETIAKAVIALMNDQKTLQVYRNNAIHFAKKFDWEKIFTKALAELCND